MARLLIKLGCCVSLCAAFLNVQAQVFRGRWLDLPKWPVFAIHVAQLPDGRYLVMNRHRPVISLQQEIFFKPCLVSPEFTQTQLCPNDVTESFCAGEIPLSDGRILIAGGHHLSDGFGRRDLWIFDPATSTWIAQSDMELARWYPTCILLPNRRVMVFSGTIDGEPYHTNASRPTMWYGGSSVDGASFESAYTFPAVMAHPIDIYYPHLFVDPQDGNLIFCANGRGAEADVQPFYGYQRLNLATLEWTPDEGAQALRLEDNTGWEYPSSCMVDGMIVRSGGSQQNNVKAKYCTARTLYNDLKGDRKWRIGPDMKLARKNHTLVVLPDGRVAAFGGNQIGQVGAGEEPRAPEVWDPKLPRQGWQLWNEPKNNGGSPLMRPYHSIAMLMPDGRVLVGGGETETHGDFFAQRVPQVFTPPYAGMADWEQHRPAITACPSIIRYGEAFELQGAALDGERLKKFTIVPLGAVTHSFNQRQCLVTLASEVTPTRDGETARLIAPAAPRIAPPGYYMLFALDTRGIPSFSKIVLLKDFDAFLPDQIEVKGAQSESEMATSQLLMPENRYYGGSLTSFANDIEINLQKHWPYVLHDTRNIRLNLQMKSSGAVPSMQLKLYNWQTRNWDIIEVGKAVDSIEKDYVIQTPDSRDSLNAYVRGEDRSFKAKLLFHADSQFSLFVDMLELAGRS